MAPVILEMDVHCLRCARKIRKAVRNMHGTYYVLLLACLPPLFSASACAAQAHVY
jgi:copper chaperone CopZ